MFAIVAQQQKSGGWFWLVVLALLLLGVVIWWLLIRRKERPVGAPMQVHPVEKQERLPDDLTRLEGIGPKVAKVLNGAGITTFSALATAKTEDVQQALNAAGLQMMNPAGWIEQAQLAAQGSWEELERLQGELKGGRRK